MLRDYRLFKIAFKVEYKTWNRDEDNSAYGDPFWTRSRDADKDANEHCTILAPNEALAVALLAHRYRADPNPKWQSYRNFQIESITEEKLDYFIEVTGR